VPGAASGELSSRLKALLGEYRTESGRSLHLGCSVLYRQTRAAEDGRDFELLKLRAIVVGAETIGAGYAVDAADARIARTVAMSTRVPVTICRFCISWSSTGAPPVTRRRPHIRDGDADERG